MTKIKLPPIFGPKSKSRLTGTNGYISLTLDKEFLITRTSYTYEEPKIEEDELSGYKYGFMNEKSYQKKEMISSIGVGYDNDNSVYFVSVCVAGVNSFINVESAENGNELLNQLVEWWQS